MVVLGTGNLPSEPLEVGLIIVGDEILSGQRADRALVRHAEGEAILRERFGKDATDSRLRMVDFPANAELIPDPLNRVPDFRLHRHCFVPGFPKMAWPMIEWVLDTHFAEYARAPAVSRAVWVDAKGSDLITVAGSTR